MINLKSILWLLPLSLLVSPLLYGENLPDKWYKGTIQATAIELQQVGDSLHIQVLYDLDKINTWREDKFERSVANGTETVFVTLRFCVVRKQLKATLKPNAAGVQLPPHYYRNG